MAVGTRRGLVRPIQNKNRMIKSRPSPGQHTVVTHPAIGGKVRCRMIGFPGFLVFFPVTIVTGGGLPVEGIVLMTLEAIQGFVDPFQPEPGIPLMIPGIGFEYFPIERGMAIGAVRAKPQFVAVVLFPVPMTGFAIGGCALHYSVQMTIGAGYGAVFSHQGKIGFIMGYGGPMSFLGGEFFARLQKYIN